MKKKSKEIKTIKIFYCKILIRRLKEIMRIMGLNDSVHWFTWFILCAVVMMFNALLLVIILKVMHFSGRMSLSIFLSTFIAQT
jgi:hypothetical protein